MMVKTSRWPVAGALALVLAVTVGAVPAGAQTAGPSGAPAASAPVAAPAAAGAVVTLVTGDTVHFRRSPFGRYEATVDPAPREGFDGSYEMVEQDDQLYVLPSDAAALVPNRLDRELFNVTKLADYGYTDGVPVIATGSAVARATGTSDRDRLASIGATAATVDPTGAWWQALPAGGGKVWLDEQVQVTLAESVPLIGAPEAWSVGLDGTGTTVAVLDTGIDVDHPDLTGRVVAERNFTDSTVVGDRFGHGTHVAGIIAGSGAASGGAYTGVAPGATLLNGKVLDDNGSGGLSGIIAGMEWAAQQGADVINMSLGGGATDGTDPLSLAVNELTAEYGVLFVISAGNSGSGDRTVGSPGAADAALTVGSVDKNEQLAWNSSRGPRLGDFAIKPDLTAPGVEIVAARAEGTALGPIVDDRYTRISGTSMAAPHVAAAAAILLQDDPDLTPDEVKARLVGSAVPNPGLEVYQQGGGRLDIPSALGAVVQAGPASLSLGHFPYPHEDDPQVSAPVTYTNLSDQPVTLDLTFAVRSREGTVPSAQMLSVSPAQLAIAPGATASATVTVDPGAGPEGLYGGYLVASAGDGAVATRTPVGFHKEPERYDITVIGIDRNGRAATGFSDIAVLDVDDMSRMFSPGRGYVDGVVRIRVAPGNYSVMGTIHTYDAHGRDIQETTLVGDPEVSVTGDTTLVFDAREAEPITVDTPDHPDAEPQGFVGLGYFRTAVRPGPLFGTAYIGTQAGREYSALPSDPVTRGQFEMYTRWRLGAPEAELAVTSPVARTLDPLLSRAPGVDGTHDVRMVDVGDGAAEDYSGVDVTGAAVLARRGPVTLVDQERHAAAAGAIALIVSNDVPGRLVGGMEAPGSIPTLTLTQADGDALRALLGQGPVTVRLSGTRWSDYLYDLVLLGTDRIPDRLSYTADVDTLARLDISYHNDVPGHEMTEVRHFGRPFHSSYAALHPHIDGARERTEYLIGGDGMSYHQTVYGEAPFEASLQEQAYRSYEQGERVTRSWFEQVVRPALLPGVGLTTREGNTLDLEVYEWVDADGNHFPEVFGLAPYPGDTMATRLYQDGELVGEADKPRGTFPMAPGASEYRLELDVSREAPWWRRSTSTSTSWTFTSQRPTGGTTAVLPLLSVDYLVDLDLWNRPVRPPGPPVVGFQVRQQTPDQPAVAGARLWVSYDDGRSWRSRPVRATGGGRFEAVVPAGGRGNGSGYVSLRVEAWDVTGNRIEQEVIRALSAR